MLKDENNKIDREIILKVIRSLKERGWDINPYTVADELGLSRSEIYRNVEAMQLIVEERQGTFGIDVAASLDVARKIQELEKAKAELLDRLTELKTEQHSQIELPDLSHSAPSAIPEAAVSESIVEPVRAESDIFSVSKIGEMPVPELNPFLNLGWRDIEAIYNFPVLSLKDYAAAAKTAVKETVPQAIYSDLTLGGPHYKFDPSTAVTGASYETRNMPEVLAKEVLETVPIYPDLAPENKFDPSLPAPESVPETTPGSEKWPTGTIEGERSAPFYSDITTDSATASIASAPSQTPQPGQPISSSIKELNPAENVPVPDLDSLDIFEGFENIADLQHIQVIDDVSLDNAIKELPADNVGSPAETEGLAERSDTSEELRNLINSRIKQASDQLADQSSPPKSSDDVKAAQNLGRSKFVGSGKPQEAAESQAFVTKAVPTDIRKACLLLGVRPEELTPELVQESWKRQIAAPGVHPDLGGDTESAIYLNTAKDSLLHWLEAQAPKLGKRFKQAAKEPSQPKRSNENDKDK